MCCHIRQQNSSCSGTELLFVLWCMKGFLLASAESLNYPRSLIDEFIYATLNQIPANWIDIGPKEICPYCNSRRMAVYLEIA